MSPTHQTIDHWIRTGELSRARAALTALLGKRVPETSRVALASLLRRVGMSGEALKLLQSLVHGTARRVAHPSEEARLEYAANLARVGSSVEAEEWLGGVDVEKHPQGLLVKASLHVGRWDYRAAIPLYRRFLRADAPRYLQLVCGVNLASALVQQGDSVKAAHLLDRLGHEALRAKNHLLYVVILELKAQAMVLASRFTEACRFVEKSFSDGLSRDSRESLLLRKWKAVAAASRPSMRHRGLSDLARVREGASGIGMFETVRDCDRWEAILRRDPELLGRVYYGSPHVAFREDVRRQWGGKDFPAFYVWGSEASKSPVRDLEAYLSDPATAQIVRRCFAALTHDLYRPVRTVELHELLFPGDHFNPVSSPGRVRQALSRFRRWVAAEKVPVRQLRSGGGQRLELVGRARLRLTAHRELSLREDGLIRLIETVFPTESFSVREILAREPMPRRTAQRRLQSLVEREILVSEGSGRGVLYRLRSSRARAG